MPLFLTCLTSIEFIEANILNLSTFNRDEAANMVMFYKTMMVSSRTLQMNDYALINLLEELRKTISLNNPQKLQTNT